VRVTTRDAAVPDAHALLTSAVASRIHGVDAAAVSFVFGQTVLVTRPHPPK
jgi:hypothetical protein